MSAKTLGKLIFGDADTYIKSINPSGKKVTDVGSLRLGDMEGMLPSTAKPLYEKGGVRYLQDGDDFYAMALNPNTNELDVVGHHLNLREKGVSALQVVDEMQGKGIGSELSYLYRKNNPQAPAGGFSDAGERTARKTYDRLKNEGILGAGILGALGLPQDATAADIVFAERPELSEQGQQEVQQLILDTLMGFMAPTRLGDATMDAYNRNRNQ